ncbi:MAG TPA: YdcF family protein [Terracidiphilus sp.]|nr:YdcF family protein [Terracidiphilus sp.]
MAKVVAMRGGAKARRRSWAPRTVLVLLVALAAMAAVWCRWVYAQIETYAHEDQAAPADAIAVLGAAEYDGHPSPVFRARLDHALDLYRKGIAPLMITVGGPGGDAYNEGTVGSQYLISQGVPERDIIAETHSRDTEQSAGRIAVIARANGLHRIVVVSDPTHLFRIHAICEADGLEVLTSPRYVPPVDDGSLEFERVSHEIVSYTLWRLHLH